MARPSRWDDVVEAAARVFRRRGFAKASLEEIADELGMWKGSLYNYISSKEDLLTAVVDIPADRLIAEAREICSSQDAPEDKLCALIRCHVDVLVDIYDFAAVYLYEVAGRDLGPKWRKIDRQYTDLVEQVIVEGIASGVFRADQETRLTTMTVIGALNWLTRWWDPSGAIGPETVAAQVAGTVLDGLRPRPPRRAARRG